MVHYFKTYFVTKDPRKLNIAINTCLKNLKVILSHMFFSLNISEYLKYHQH